jgi:hypothetical protein
VGLVMLGLVMHAAGLHGSAPHLIGAAMMFGATMWLTPLLRRLNTIAIAVRRRENGQV